MYALSASPQNLWFGNKQKVNTTYYNMFTIRYYNILFSIINKSEGLVSDLHLHAEFRLIVRSFVFRVITPHFLVITTDSELTKLVVSYNLALNSATRLSYVFVRSTHAKYLRK